jgi:hypothetical protein
MQDLTDVIVALEHIQNGLRSIDQYSAYQPLDPEHFQQIVKTTTALQSQLNGWFRSNAARASGLNRREAARRQEADRRQRPDRRHSLDGESAGDAGSSSL